MIANRMKLGGFGSQKFDSHPVIHSRVRHGMIPLYHTEGELEHRCICEMRSLVEVALYRVFSRPRLDLKISPEK